MGYNNRQLTTQYSLSLEGSLYRIAPCGAFER
jgi:hypothetical protein